MLGNPIAGGSLGDTGTEVVQVVPAWVRILSPLESPAILGDSAGAFVVELRGEIPSPLGIPSVSIVSDFTNLITDPTETYIMQITGSPPVEIPISSWQATVQSAAQSFLQCVVPAAADYVDILSARQSTEQMVVYRKTVIGGQTLEREMARASIGTIQIDAGSTRYTITLRGYAPAFSDPVSSSVVTLTSIRSQSLTVGGAVRIRANIDWLLRPGQVATDGDVQFTVGYINYFVPSSGDAYMDVGTRG